MNAIFEAFNFKRICNSGDVSYFRRGNIKITVDNKTIIVKDHKTLSVEYSDRSLLLLIAYALLPSYYRKNLNFETINDLASIYDKTIQTRAEKLYSDRLLAVMIEFQEIKSQNKN